MVLYEFYQNPWPSLTVLIILVVWDLIWKGIGMWYAARNRQKAWYICMLIFNTIGILPIVYLLFFKPKLNHKNALELLQQQVTAKSNGKKRKKKK